MNKTRSYRDPNDFILEEDICKIVLFNRAGEQTGITKIDIDDYKKVINFQWYLNNNGYVYSGKGDICID